MRFLLLTFLLSACLFSEIDRKITSYYEDGTPHILEQYEGNGFFSSKKLTTRFEFLQNGRLEQTRFKDDVVTSITTYSMTFEEFEGAFIEDIVKSLLSWKDFFDNGKLKYEQVVIDSLTFKKTVYWKNGNKRSEFHVKRENTKISIDDAKRYGHSFYYYPNGKKSFELYRDDDGADLFVNCWNKDGIQTLKNGNGLFLEYHNFNESESIEERFECQDSIRHGKYEWFYLNGNKRIVGEYQNGNRYGNRTYYNEDGSKHSKRFYLDSLTIKNTLYWKNGNKKGVNYTRRENTTSPDNTAKSFGLATLYYDNGKKSYELYRDDDGADSFVNCWNKNGIQILKNGNGLFIGYHKFNESDIIEERFGCQDSIRHGKYESFYLNGNKEIVGEYQKGNKHGIWIYYNEDGSIDKEENY